MSSVTRQVHPDVIFDGIYRAPHIDVSIFISASRDVRQVSQGDRDHCCRRGFGNQRVAAHEGGPETLGDFLYFEEKLKERRLSVLQEQMRTASKKGGRRRSSGFGQSDVIECNLGNDVLDSL